LIAKRGHTNLSGILAIDKSSGLSSHAVVDRVRQATGEGRVGHAGTLDPLASGLLVVCVGSACRLTSYLMLQPKTYLTRLVFGASTDTDDATGHVQQQAALPARLGDADFARDFLLSLIGPQLQLPPAFSAIKRQGQKAYKVARQGRNLELEPRPIEILDISLLALGSNFWDIRVRASKGTYIRSLARDIGRALGSQAHVGALRRIQHGALHVSAAVAVPGELVAGFSGIAGMQDRDDLAGFSGAECTQGADSTAELFRGTPAPFGAQPPFIDPLQALELPALAVDSRRAALIANGRPLHLTAAALEGGGVQQICRPAPITRFLARCLSGWETDVSGDRHLAPTEPDQRLVAITHTDRLLALYRWDNRAASCSPAAEQQTSNAGAFGSEIAYENDNSDSATLTFVPEAVLPGGIALRPAAPSLQESIALAPSSQTLDMATRFVAIGVFDGVHAGHQVLLRALADVAAIHQAKPAVLTFDRDPDALLFPDRLQKLLSDNQRQELLRALSGEVMTLRFDEHLARLSWQQFLTDSLGGLAHLDGIFVGNNFRFGAQAAGGIQELSQWAMERGAKLYTQDLLKIDGEPVSASRIRCLLAQGNVCAAAALLTRNYAVWGSVVAGNGRGRQLGFATANVIVDAGYVSLQKAVYAAYCQLDGHRYRAAVSVGAPPSFAPFPASRAGDIANEDALIEEPGAIVPALAFRVGDIANLEHQLDHSGHPTDVLGQQADYPGRQIDYLGQQTDDSSQQTNLFLEAHLLDFSGNAYGQRLRIEFVKKLRPMERFDHISKLQAAVRQNIQWVRQNL
jgi:tRNA pseudouridine55 synthase